MMHGWMEGGSEGWMARLRSDLDMAYIRLRSDKASAGVFQLFNASASIVSRRSIAALVIGLILA